MIGKEIILDGSEKKTVSIGSEVTSGGRLFRVGLHPPETHDRQKSRHSWCLHNCTCDDEARLL